MFVQRRAQFVMGNSAAGARGPGLETGKQLIEAKTVDVTGPVESDFIYTVTLACALWFLVKAKASTGGVDTALLLTFGTSITRLILRTGEESSSRPLDS